MTEIRRITKTGIPMVERWKTDRFTTDTMNFTPEERKKIKMLSRELKELHEQEKRENEQATSKTGDNK